jgi:hypothetical protein
MIDAVWTVFVILVVSLVATLIYGVWPWQKKIRVSDVKEVLTAGNTFQPPHRTYKNGERLSDGEADVLEEGGCPDCGHRQLIQGPSGGFSVNVYCADEQNCGSRFNVMGPFGIERITDASPKKKLIENKSAYRN